jgi:hypothetical protein
MFQVVDAIKNVSESLAPILCSARDEQVIHLVRQEEVPATPISTFAGTSP